jgi:hypothetical protein
MDVKSHQDLAALRRTREDFGEFLIQDVISRDLVDYCNEYQGLFSIG